MLFDLPKNNWNNFFTTEAKQPYFQAIVERYDHAIADGATLFPPKEQIFYAYEKCQPEDVKVVILGQDPYLSPGEAHGLAFSVPNGQKAPKSLKNIFEEIYFEFDERRTNTDLTDWAEQGVLLLNTILTVYPHKRLSCSEWGWQTLIEHTLNYLNKECQHLVFILWGTYAQEFKVFIDQSKHTILETPHPSPLSAYRGFFESNVFLRANDDLLSHGIKPINWKG